MSVNSETQTSGRPRRSRVSRVRKAVLAIAFALFCAGVVVAGGLGDACSVGYEAIAAVCPLGALDGAKAVTPLAQQNQLNHDDRREHKKIERRLIEPHEAIERNHRGEREPNGTKEAEDGKSAQRRCGQRPGQHRMARIKLYALAGP